MEPVHIDLVGFADVTRKRLQISKWNMTHPDILEG
jgi:hypothetical protein